MHGGHPFPAFQVSTNYYILNKCSKTRAAPHPLIEISVDTFTTFLNEVLQLNGKKIMSLALEYHRNPHHHMHQCSAEKILKFHNFLIF